MRKHIHVGMDVGASAVKCIVLDTDGKILWRQYIHHDCRVMETVERVMTDLVAVYEGSEAFLCMTGQGGEDIAERFGVSFIPEIAAQSDYLSRFGRDVDAVIEIGGESAKITYLHPVWISGLIGYVPAVRVRFWIIWQSFWEQIPWDLMILPAEGRKCILSRQDAVFLQKRISRGC